MRSRLREGCSAPLREARGRRRRRRRRRWRQQLLLQRRSDDEEDRPDGGAHAAAPAGALLGGPLPGALHASPRALVATFFSSSSSSSVAGRGGDFGAGLVGDVPASAARLVAHAALPRPPTPRYAGAGDNGSGSSSSSVIVGGGGRRGWAPPSPMLELPLVRAQARSLGLRDGRRAPGKGRRRRRQQRR